MRAFVSLCSVDTISHSWHFFSPSVIFIFHCHFYLAEEELPNIVIVNENWKFDLNGSNRFVPTSKHIIMEIAKDWKREKSVNLITSKFSLCTYEMQIEKTIEKEKPIIFHVQLISNECHKNPWRLKPTSYCFEEIANDRALVRLNLWWAEME